MVNGRCHTHIVHILRAVAIRFGVVRFIVCAQERYTLGGSGGMFPQKILAMRLLLRHFGGNMMLLGGQTTEFDMNECLPFLLIASYTTGGHLS